MTITRLSLVPAAALIVLALAGCSKDTGAEGAPPATGAGTSAGPAGGAPNAQGQMGQQSGYRRGGGEDVGGMNKALNDPNTPESVKAQLRAKQGGGR